MQKGKHNLTICWSENIFNDAAITTKALFSYTFTFSILNEEFSHFVGVQVCFATSGQFTREFNFWRICVNKGLKVQFLFMKMFLEDVDVSRKHFTSFLASWTRESLNGSHIKVPPSPSHAILFWIVILRNLTLPAACMQCLENALCTIGDGFIWVFSTLSISIQF